MDPLSQATLGAMGAQLHKNKKINLKRASLFGALAGMAPDLDILIRSSKDPLLYIEYHRQFTHSLFFIPIGALCVSLFLKIFKVRIRDSYCYTLLGYATHALLDACTNYGTQLLWPFAKIRVAWNLLAVIDPLLTIPLVVLTILVIRKRDKKYLLIAWSFLALYLGLSFVQRERVMAELKERTLIERETDLLIKPTLGNNFIWRVVQEKDEHYKFFAVRLGLINENQVYIGQKIKKVIDSEVKSRYSPLQYRDYERFKYFSNGYLIWTGDHRISDARYSMVYHQAKPLWFIEFTPSKPNEHVDYVIDRQLTEQHREMIKSIWRGQDFNNLEN